MQRHTWLFLVVFLSSVPSVSADNAQQGSVSGNYDGKKELPQISANPRKPQAANPSANADDKKASKPRSTSPPEEPEINIGGWDRGGEMPKKAADPDPTILLNDEASSATKPGTDIASDKPIASDKFGAKKTADKASADKPGPGAGSSAEKPVAAKALDDSAVNNASAKANCSNARDSAPKNSAGK